MLVNDPLDLQDPAPTSYSKRPKSPTQESDKLYVGHLPPHFQKKDLEYMFNEFGVLKSVEIKHGGYAFVQFEQLESAQEACRQLNGYRIQDKRLQVEFSNKKQNGDACILCGEVGHWARDCPLNKEKGLDVKSGKCFKCGSFGHLARFCRGERMKPYDRRYEEYRRPSSPRYDRRYDDYPRRSPSYQYDYYYRDFYRERFYDDKYYDDKPMDAYYDRKPDVYYDKKPDAYYDKKSYDRPMQKWK
ncbi:hypothetical protein EDD86DRAFT_197333 [Gorgonomyces haynaldii]|nr:hypothetical protein EDD86DRAFT_197333 [Gorgonomyces haynaldii]